jgi:hypothetical protein
VVVVLGCRAIRHLPAGCLIICLSSLASHEASSRLVTPAHPPNAYPSLSLRGPSPRAAPTWLTALTRFLWRAPSPATSPPCCPWPATTRSTSRTQTHPGRESSSRHLGATSRLSRGEDRGCWCLESALHGGSAALSRVWHPRPGTRSPSLSPPTHMRAFAAAAADCRTARRACSRSRSPRLQVCPARRRPEQRRGLP